MDSKYKYLFKNVGILFIGNFASKVLVFLLVPLYTYALTTSGYGIFDLSASVATLLYPVLTLNVADGVMRYLLDKENKNDVIRIGITYMLFSIMICFVGILAVKQTALFRDYKDLYVIIFLYFCTYVLNQFFIQTAKGLEKVNIMAIAGLASTMVMLIGNIVFLLYLKIGLKGFYYANIISQIISIIILIIGTDFWNAIKKSHFDKSLNTKLIKYSFPLIFSTLGWWINSSSDKYAVTALCGIASNGILAVAYKIPAILNTIFGMYGQAWQISAIKEHDDDSSIDFYSDSFIFLNYTYCIFCSILICFIKLISKILFSNDFYLAWQYVPFLIISSIFNMASGFVGPLLLAEEKTKPIAKSAVIGATINVVLNIVMVYMIGIQGACIATAVSSFIIYYYRKKAASKLFQIKKYSICILLWIMVVLQAFIKVYLHIDYIDYLILFVEVIICRNVLKRIVDVPRRTIKYYKSRRGR